MNTRADRATGSGWQQASVAAAYEDGLVPALFEPWARHLVGLVDLRRGERVLDLACGTGIVARTAAPRVSESGSVTGVDVNADMLEVAARAATDVRPEITWMCASADDTGLPNGSFDVGFCQQGLQFCPDRLGVCRELHRVVAPGGRVAVSVWCDPDSPGYVPLRTALAGPLPGALEFLHSVFTLSDADELRGLLATAGFREVQVQRRTADVRFPSAEAWVEAFLAAAPLPRGAALPLSRRAAVTRHVTDALQSYVGPAGLAFPLAANTAVATR